MPVGWLTGICRRTCEGKKSVEQSRGWGLKVGIGLLVLALVAGGIWGGLTWFGRDKDSPREAAQRVAAGVAAAKLAPGSVVVDGAEPDLAAVVKGMGKATHKVTVGSVSEAEGDTATATLKHSWTVPGSDATWDYETPLELRRGEETWQGVWAMPVMAPDLADGEVLRVRRQQPERAQIIGAGDKPIVEPREVQRIGIDKTKVSGTEATDSARKLAQAVGVNADNFVKAVQNAGAEAFVEAITARVDSPQEQAARELQAPGVFMVKASIPLAPTSGFARPILGVVGDATAEIVEKSEGRVVAGDRVGMGGVQSAYDAQLSGQPGYSVVTSGGPSARTLFTAEPTPGRPVTLTLDIATQQAAEKVLEKVEPASAIVAIQPSTGNVLAAASGPGSEGQSTATQARVAPGSTFKSVSTLALLRSGLTPESSVECTPTITVDGRSFKNFDDYPSSALGKVSLSTAFANSCNTAIIRAGEKLEPAALPDAAAALGLTAEPALGISSFLGDVPEPQPGTDEAASMIGQSKVVASPLGMATVAASIKAGKAVAPRLVVGGEAAAGAPAATGSASPSASGSPSGSPTEAEPQAPENPLTGAEATALQGLMRGVVTEGGADFLQDVPGEPVLAKTGTAEFGEAGALKAHAWMIAIHGDLAVAVFVQDGEGGAATAGPLMEAFLRARQGDN